MDRFNKLNGSVKAAFTVALVLVMTGALALLAAEKAASEKPASGFLGVSVRSLDDEEREKLGVTHGVQVAAIEKESAAAKAGIREDDVIQSVNGEKVRGPRALTDIVREAKPGSAAKIGLWRDGKALEVKAVLGTYERPKRSHWSVGPLTKSFRSRAYLGVNIMDLDDDLASYFSVRAGEGVLVTGVEKETPAAKAGIKSGDVIVQLGDTAVKESGNIQKALAELKQGDGVAITIVRHGKKETLQALPDYNRRQRIMRVFSGDKEIEIEHLKLPEMNIEIPDIEAPEPPESPDHEEIIKKVQKSMEGMKFKIEKRLKKIGENYWI